MLAYQVRATTFRAAAPGTMSKLPQEPRPARSPLPIPRGNQRQLQLALQLLHRVYARMRDGYLTPKLRKPKMSTATLLAKLRDLNRRIKAGELDLPPQKFKRYKCGPKRKTPTPTTGLTRE